VTTEEFHKVTMHYEGDRTNLATLMCVFTYQEREYRVMYFKMHYYAELFELPKDVREYILHWADMLNSPD
jgi:hypothetical protein